MGVLDKIINLTKQLYPTGRAFNYPDGGVMYKLHKALGQSEKRAVEDLQSILFQILPDNANFTADDATRWEQRLGMINGSALSLSDRKSAILRKINHPGDIPARQSHDYLQDQLQAAGFDVYVHENTNNQTIEDVLSLNLNFQQFGQAQFGDFQFGNVYSYYSSLFDSIQFGDSSFGSFQWGKSNYYKNKVVNHIPQSLGVYFNIGSNLTSTFFIGGAVLGDFVNVDLLRRDEFRQLILKTKPVQTVGYLLVDYI